MDEYRDACMQFSAYDSSYAAPPGPSVVFVNNVVSGSSADPNQAATVHLENSVPPTPPHEWGTLVEGNTFSGQAVGGAPALRLETTAAWASPTDKASYTQVVNNTFESSTVDGGPLVLMALPENHLLGVTHNTLLGGGFSLDSVPTGSGGNDLGVHLNNNAISAADADSFTVSGDPEVAVTGEGNVVTTPGDLPEGSYEVAAAEAFLLGDLASNGSLFAPLTMLPGEGSALIDAGVAADSLPETDQRGLPRVTGTAPDAGAVEVPAPPVAEPVVVTLGADATVLEGETAEFVVSRAGSDAEAAQVRVVTADESAVAGRDYVAVDEVLTWAAGAMEPKTVRVATTAQDPVDAKRGFTVTLSDPAEGTVIGDPGQVRGFITDEQVDPPIVAPVDPPVTSPWPPPAGGAPLEQTGGAPVWPVGLAALVLAGAGGAALLVRRFRVVRSEREAG